MAARSTWKGYIKLSLVSVPVKAYTANSSGGEIRLNQLHNACHSRINYKKTCPIHGEVPNDEILSGYEYSKDQYVIIDTDELDKLRSEDDKAVKIESFIKPDAVDPIYFNGKDYYLVPEGPVGQKAYSVIYQGMVEAARYGVVQVVMHGKEQIGLLRPVEGLLVMSMLHYDNQVTKPSTFAEEAPHTQPSVEELKLAKALISSVETDKFDLAQYKDKYTENLTKLIEAKVSGQELVAPPVQEQAQVINLMDALRQSVEKMQKPGAAATPAAAASETEEKPPKRMAASKGTKEAAPKKKRKTS
ncbi:MAG: Ku protein [Gemmataceae bacterium]